MAEETTSIDRRDVVVPSPIEIKETTPATVLDLAIEKGASLNQLEKFLDLKLRWEANEARKAYHEAMAAFKMTPPDIEKDKTVSYTVQGKGTTTYSHASLANVTSKINKSLSEHGLSAAWITSQEERGVTVTCTITHRLGHSESTSLTAAPDTSGSKNSIQAIGSSITYLQRYTLLALVGLATHDMDDDGRTGAGSEPVYITEAQIDQLKKERDLRKTDSKVFLAHFDIESLDQLPAKRFDEAMRLIKARPVPAKGREPGEEG